MNEDFGVDGAGERQGNLHRLIFKDLHSQFQLFFKGSIVERGVVENKVMAWEV